MRLIKLKAVSAHVPPSTVNMIGFLVQTAVKVITLFAKAGKVHSGCQLIAYYLWQDHEHHEVKLLRSGPDFSAPLEQHTYLKASIQPIGIDQTWPPLLPIVLQRSTKLCIPWLTPSASIWTVSNLLSVYMTKVWMAGTRWRCTILKKRPTCCGLDCSRALSLRCFERKSLQ